MTDQLKPGEEEHRAHLGTHYRLVFREDGTTLEFLDSVTGWRPATMMGAWLVVRAYEVGKQAALRAHGITTDGEG